MIKKKIKKILVPLDGSKNSFRGLDRAIYLARQCQAILTGVYIIPIYPKNLWDSIIPFQIQEKRQAKKFMQYSKTRAAKKGVPFRSKIIYGSPTVEIIDMAKNKKFDLIVIGSRGHHGIKEVFLGSVANVIVHKSPIPVLVEK